MEWRFELTWGIAVPQTKSADDSDDADHASRAVSDYGQDSREECGTGGEQVLFGPGQFFQHSQQQPSQDVKNPGIPTRSKASATIRQNCTDQNKIICYLKLHISF